MCRWTSAPCSQSNNGGVLVKIVLSYYLLYDLCTMQMLHVISSANFLKIKHSSSESDNLTQIIGMVFNCKHLFALINPLTHKLPYML